ncbi:unnamed protein product [Trifolium pratense]|uniref:Uncharacterized protein n=1 Tax=Trifolium pratense TaxID=57577 RepID=A0ACB0JW65_TRIPR|nr:unnamed protein product [Trifolium pratense]
MKLLKLVLKLRCCFKLAVVYERLPDFSTHSGTTGHNVQACNCLKSCEAKIDNCDKKIITIKMEVANMQYVPKKKDNVLASTSVEVEKKKLAIQFDRNT